MKIIIGIEKFAVVLQRKKMIVINFHTKLIQNFLFLGSSERSKKYAS